MAARVIIKLKDGSEKNMEKPLAQRLEKRGLGKIQREVLSKGASLRGRALELDAREKVIEKREKELEKQNGKPETRKTK